MTFRGLAGVVLILTGAMCADAHAADARLLRVVLLRSADRISRALEMTAEPQKASLRALSDRILELEAGPVIGPVRDEELAPASGVPVIKQVTIRKYSSGSRAVFVRARMMLHGSTRGDVRVMGRVVYVDFAAPPTDSPVPTFEEVSVSAPSVAGGVHLSTVARGGLTLREPQGHSEQSRGVSGVEGQASEVLPTPAYHDAVRPLFARLAEIGPFLLSAAAAPTPDVLAAVGRSLMEVEGRLRAMDVPPASRPTHDQLLLGVAEANRAVAPDFRGDRAAQAHRALALIQGSGVRGQGAGSGSSSSSSSSSGP